MRSNVLGATVAVLTACALAACSSSSGGHPAAGANPGGGGTSTSAAPVAPPTSTTTSAPTTSLSETATPQPSSSSTTTSPPVTPTAPAKLRLGDKGAAVLALQKRLAALGYWLGQPDGTFGGLTQQAVYAVQKAAGLGRDGVVGVKTQAALTAGKRPTITTKGTGHRVEINKQTQLLLIIDGATITTILNTSTGSGRPYLQDGKRWTALTPSGSFHVTRQIDGERVGPLGALWRPKYFNAGIAIHGLDSVPPYPASHGCARVSNAAIDWIWATNQVPIGTPVTVV